MIVALARLGPAAALAVVALGRGFPMVGPKQFFAALLVAWICIILQAFGFHWWGGAGHLNVI